MKAAIAMFPSERLKGIEAFVCTADAGSFTAAAERLHLTGSAVGKAVARLEARLATRLFERTTRRLRLTDAGEAFYRTCVRVLGELESAEQVLAAEHLEPAGRLRVDLPALYGRMKVMPLLLEFAQRHAAVQPQVSFTDRFVDVVDEGIDVAVRIGGSVQLPAGLGQRLLGRERLVFCASPAYLERRGAPDSLQALAGHDAVAYGRTDAGMSAWQSSAGAIAVQPRMVLGDGEAVVAAVMAGCGIAKLATWMVEAPLRDGHLLRLLPGAEVDGLPLHLVWPRSRQLLPKVDALLRHLAQGLTI